MLRQGSLRLDLQHNNVRVCPDGPLAGRGQAYTGSAYHLVSARIFGFDQRSRRMDFLQMCIPSMTYRPCTIAIGVFGKGHRCAIQRCCEADTLHTGSNQISNEKDFPVMPTMKLTGFLTAAQTSRTPEISGSPGAKRTSAPVFSKP
jgi:hypothetical protein